MIVSSREGNNLNKLCNLFSGLTNRNKKKFDSKLTPNQINNSKEKKEEEKEPKSPHMVDPHTQSTLDYWRDNRNLRKLYAWTAVILAGVSILAWLFFISYIYIYNGYKEGIHTEKVLGIVTAACTVNILTAFISITKGLFNISNKK